MYNIAKVAKGEILLFFNDIFDALSKVPLVEITIMVPAKSLFSLPQTVNRQ